MTAPLTPTNSDLRDYPRMMIDIPRLFGSEFNATASDAEWRYGVTLWLKSFHQTPIASLPDDDVQLARLVELGKDVRSWLKAKAGALRGWIKCSDGRLYHPVVAEVALEALLSKLRQRLKSGAGNAKRYGGTFDPAPIEAEMDAALACLDAISPGKAKPRSEAPTGTPPGSPAAIPAEVPQRSQVKERDVLPEGASAPTDPNKEAWQRGVRLLTASGRMKEPGARQLFGKLLKDHRLEARDLLPSVVKAEGLGTADPQGYLTAAARGVASTRGGAPAPASSADWGDEQWTVALRFWRERGEWSDTLGPEPGQPGCRVPAHLMLGEVA